MKLKAILIAGLAGVVCGPVLAAECKYVSGMDQGSVSFVGNVAVLTDGAGDSVDCGVTYGDESGNTLQCDGYPEANWSLAASTVGGSDSEELLVLWDHVWYRTCE